MNYLRWYMPVSILQYNAHDGQHDFFIGHWLSFWSTPSLDWVLFSIFHGVTHVLPSLFHWFRRPSLTAYGVDFFCDCPPCFSFLYDNLAYLLGLRYKAVIKLNFFQQAGVFFFRKFAFLHRFDTVLSARTLCLARTSATADETNVLYAPAPWHGFPWVSRRYK